MENQYSARIENLKLLDSGLESDREKAVYFSVKRIFDAAVSALGIVVLVPLFLIVAIAVWAEDGGPVFYKQERVGKDKKKFYIYKFRSMKKDAEQTHEKLREQYGSKEVSFKLKDDPRITKVGKVIRKINIDELPQLFNILKGDMSIVGPRPLPVYEFEEEQRLYGSRFERRYSVPGGLTCYWQIANRSEIEFEERMEMDVQYVNDENLWLDLRLIIKTFFYTIIGKAAY